jgi:hypothetical protein
LFYLGYGEQLTLFSVGPRMSDGHPSDLAGFLEDVFRFRVATDVIGFQSRQ